VRALNAQAAYPFFANFAASREIIPFSNASLDKSPVIFPGSIDCGSEGVSMRREAIRETDERASLGGTRRGRKGAILTNHCRSTGFRQRRAAGGGQGDRTVSLDLANQRIGSVEQRF
jgi:hypothetical protein